MVVLGGEFDFFAKNCPVVCGINFEVDTLLVDVDSGVRICLSIDEDEGFFFDDLSLFGGFDEEAGCGEEAGDLGVYVKKEEEGEEHDS